MEFLLSKLMFQPQPSSYKKDSFNNHLIYIPDKLCPEEKIPCLYFSSKKPKIVIIYFHQNADDIGNSYNFLLSLTLALDCIAICPEYPGYGIREGSPNIETVCNTAESILHFIKLFKIPNKNIITIGRSIGSLPATYISQNREETSNDNDEDHIAGVILIAAFSNISDLSEKLFFHGISRLVNSLGNNKLDNIDNLRNFKGFLFCLHGELDELVPFFMGKKNFDSFKGEKYFRGFKNIDHCRWDEWGDIVIPIQNLLDSKLFELDDEIAENFLLNLKNFKD